VLVNRARNALADSAAIRTGTGGYALSDTADCVIDAEVFLLSTAQAAEASGSQALAQLRDALAAWGDPLPEDAYAEWSAPYRDRLWRARQQALEQAARLAVDEGEAEAAVEFSSVAADAEPLREVAVLALVRALAAAGDRAGALARYDAYRHALADELGIDPSTQAQALHQELLHGTAATQPVRPGLHAASTVTELAFVGRERELAAIDAVLPADHGGTVVVYGPSGNGKSRLLQAVAERTPTVSVRAYLPERAEPWSMLRTLVREVLAQDVGQLVALPQRLSSALRTLLPELDAADPPTAPDDPESTRALIQEAVVRLLTPVRHLIAIDDLQWSDPTSVALLESARSRLPGLRLVLAVRPEEIADGDPVADLLRRLPADAELRLHGLAPAAISQLVADAGLVAMLADATDGSPLAVREVIAALAADGLITRTTTRGGWRPVSDQALRRGRELARQGQRHALALRARQLDEAQRDLLVAMCLLARETTTSTLAVATDASDAHVTEGLTRLFRAGLVRLGESGWTTSHDMVNEAVASDLDTAARAHQHARIAAALDSTGADPAELARHWLAAGDRPRAAVAFSRAAHSALDAFADQEAVDAATAGLALAPIETPELLEIRAQALGRLGRIAAARDDLRAALAGRPTGADRARLLGRLAMLASGSEDLVRAAELAEHALLEAGSDQPARAQALEIASVLDMNLARRDRAEQRSAAALQIYQQLGDARGAARVLDARAMATFLDGDVRAGTSALRRAADLFEDSGDLVRVITPRSTSGHAMVFGGDAADGLRAATAALELARTLGNPEGQAYSLWHRAEALSALRRADEAMHDAREALEVATGLGHRGWTATAWRAVGIAAQAAGDLPDALAAFESSLSLSEHLHLFASWAAARAALVLVALGDSDRAAQMLTRVPAEGPPLARYETLLAQIELAAARGATDVPAQAREAISVFDRGGVRQGRDRLATLAG
jgi:DNA-binding SARP family transcriptional activator/tetratricopeptide (TPR) repeat protein